MVLFASCASMLEVIVVTCNRKLLEKAYCSPGVILPLGDSFISVKSMFVLKDLNSAKLVPQRYSVNMKNCSMLYKLFIFVSFSSQSILYRL